MRFCRDEMQNLTCVLNPESDARIMLSAHADEIGLMISNIREDGRLQVIDRGGIVPATYPGRQVRIKTKHGEVYGVVEAYRGFIQRREPWNKAFFDRHWGERQRRCIEDMSASEILLYRIHRFVRWQTANLQRRALG